MSKLNPTGNYAVFNDDGLHGRYSSLESARKQAKELDSDSEDFHVRKLILVGDRRRWLRNF
jgi:hypothetical protein